MGWFGCFEHESHESSCSCIVPLEFSARRPIHTTAFGSDIRKSAGAVDEYTAWRQHLRIQKEERMGWIW
jgi:hypothetical protein